VATNKPFSLDAEALYRDLFTPLFRYVFFRTSDYDIACDVTQTSFLKFLQQNKSVATPEHAQKLLFVIARHTLVDYWRSGAVRKTVIQTEWGEVLGTDSTPEENCIAVEDQTLVAHMVAMLESVEAEVVSLRLADNLSYEVIAHTLNISSANARKIYSRALQKVRMQLQASNYF
jgi:RNA polymerase sigma-70 factor (ECF subfamily)